MIHHFLNTALVFAATPAIALAPDFKLAVYFEYSGQRCASGYLDVNGSIISYTLERPWKDNQPNFSSIPAGTYPGNLRYNHKDHCRIEMQNVPHRSNVQIHTCDEPDESKGSLFLGTQRGPDLCKIFAGASGPVFAAFKRAFYGTENPISTPVKIFGAQLVDTCTANNIKRVRLSNGSIAKGKSPGAPKGKGK